MSREKLLGQARADLVALPDLYAQLERTLTERNHDVSGYAGKVVGSPAPLQLPVVHLADVRHKPGWDLEEPRETKIGDRYGITPTLELWVRTIWEEQTERHQLTEDEAWIADKWPDGFPEVIELTEIPTVRSECDVLKEYWAHIEAAHWGIRCANDIIRLTNMTRTLLGIKPEPEYRCPQCHNPAYIQPGGILACTEVADHDLVVRDLEQQQRRRPPITTGEVHAEFGVQPGTLRQWKNRRKIKPARTEHGRNWWFPWDVFCLVNPDIAEAIARREEIEVG